MEVDGVTKNPQKCPPNMTKKTRLSIATHFDQVLKITLSYFCSLLIVTQGKGQGGNMGTFIS